MRRGGRRLLRLDRGELEVVDVEHRRAVRDGHEDDAVEVLEVGGAGGVVEGLRRGVGQGQGEIVLAGGLGAEAAVDRDVYPLAGWELQQALAIGGEPTGGVGRKVRPHIEVVRVVTPVQRDQGAAGFVQLEFLFPQH